MLIGEHTAEAIKIEIGSSVVGNRQKETQVRGRDVVTGLPKTITLTSDETAEAMNDTIDSMIASAHDVLSETPPELASDIIDRGIVITGGGALLDGISQRFSEVLTVPVMRKHRLMTWLSVQANSLSILKSCQRKNNAQKNFDCTHLVLQKVYLAASTSELSVLSDMFDLYD